MDAAIQAAVAGIDDPLLALHEQGRAYVRFGMEHPEHYRIMFMGPAYETPDQWDDLLSTGAFANLVRALQRLIAAETVPDATAPLHPALHLRHHILGHPTLRVGRQEQLW